MKQRYNRQGRGARRQTLVYRAKWFEDVFDRSFLLLHSTCRFLRTKGHVAVLHMPLKDKERSKNGVEWIGRHQEEINIMTPMLASLKGRLKRKPSG